MSKKVKGIDRIRDRDVIIEMVPNDKDTHNNSYGGGLPGFFDPKGREQTELNPNTNEKPETTTTQDTVSENPNGNTNQETKPEQNE